MKTAFDAPVSPAYNSYAACATKWQADRQTDIPPTDRRATAVRHMQVINKSSALALSSPQTTLSVQMHCNKYFIKNQVFNKDF